MGTQIVSLLTSASGGGGSLPPKVINVPADFPTTIEAYADIGRVYIAAANVTDNDPTKTNTGQSFLAGEEFVWDGVEPTGSYFKLGANALWLDDGTDYKTISPARNLDLQNKDLKNVNQATFVGATVSGLSVLGGIVQTNGSGVLSSSITLPDGTLATTQSPLDNSTKLATTAYVDAAVVIENIWDRDIIGTPFIKPHAAGDHLHLNDEESTSFTTSEFQIFKNDAADFTAWSASATAGTDANLNLIRSRGTIGTPLTVTDNDLIGNINFIGYSGSGFNNGAEIRAEINGTVSAGVLPCDLVFYVNAGAGVATEGMRLLKTKDLLVAGDIGTSGTRITKGFFTDFDIAGDLVIVGSAEIDNIRINGNTISTTNVDGSLTLDCNGAGTVSMPRAGTFGAITPATQILVGNLDISGNTLSSTSGNINITPDNPADDIIINGHWSFDGKTLVAISDSDTTLTAYAGKNIAIEGVTFDGGVVASITSLTVDDININGDTIVSTSTLDLGSSSGTGFTRIVDENGDPVLSYDNANDKFTFSENITVSKGYTGSVTTVNAITYNLLATDYILSVYYTVTGACVISLPSAQALVGRIIHIKDRGGNASVNNILISPTGGRTIDGAATVTITGDYESLAIYSDGTNWYIF